MDINLKGSVDGVETASLIRRFSESPILFLTAYADDKTIKKAKISDASGYILKPFRESELIVTIELSIKRSLIRKKIQENSKWLYTTLNHITDPVITVSLEKQIIFMNSAARELLDNEYSTGDVFDENLFIYKEKGKFYFKKGNKKLDIEYSNTEILGDDSEHLGFVHFIHDITRQIAYEEGLEKARIAAENSNRSKSDFLANVTHELRTPLNTIIGLNYLLSELVEDSEMSEMLGLVDKAAESLLSLVNELLDLAEIDRGDIKIVNSRFSLNELIEDVMGTFRSQAEIKAIALNSQIEKIPVLSGDKGKIREILSCLLSNAVKFTRHGSVLVKGKLEGEILVLTVSDTGLGMSDDQKEVIFEQFTQLDGSRTRYFGGVGVGLTLVSKLVKMLDGSISVESREQEGSSFIVKIPVVPSSDQKSRIEIQEPAEEEEFTGYHVPETLKVLGNVIRENFDEGNFDKCYQLIRTYISDKGSEELGTDSRILLKISTAIKLNDREKLEKIIRELNVNSNKSLRREL